MRRWQGVKLAAVMLTAAMAVAACGSDSKDDSSGSGGSATPSASGSSSSGGGGGGTKLKVGMAYDIGGRGDQSFNDAAAAGLDKAKSDLGIEAQEAEAAANEAESAKEERLRLLAQNGYNPVIAVGFAYAAALGKVAPQFPDTKFAIIDSSDTKGANISNLVFAEEQGSFLVGVAGALKSKKGNVGFVGGVNVPLIKKFEAGFKAGAEAAKPGTKVQVKYLTQPPDFSGFGSPQLGKTAAQGMYDAGADIVYQAAGGSGGGVFEAAKAAGAQAIGVDSDQAKTASADVKDVIITSMLKKVDVAVFDFIEKVSKDEFQAGETRYDLKAGGVDYSTTGGKIDDVKSKIDEFKQQIIDGKVTVPTT